MCVGSRRCCKARVLNVLLIVEGGFCTEQSACCSAGISPPLPQSSEERETDCTTHTSATTAGRGGQEVG